MNETTKSRKLWGELEHAVLTGRGIDIGCGPDPVTADVLRFDLEQGDANHITRHVEAGAFDFVYASHCLEHMHDPRQAVQEWWRLVRPGGHLFFMVPDEDLYEQGVFPSRFNPDHKATFTISKRRSWSPVSVNVLDLARALPGGELVKLELQDQGYDRRLLRHGQSLVRLGAGWGLRQVRKAGARVPWKFPVLTRLLGRLAAVDQTLRDDVVAQIACIVRRVG